MSVTAQVFVISQGKGPVPLKTIFAGKQMGPVPSSGMPQTHVVDVTLWSGKAVCMPVHC